MSSKLITLFAYNLEANQSVLDLMLHHENILSERVLALMSHIVNAHHIWNNRILEQMSQLGVWQLHALAEIISINRENHESSNRILNDFDLEKIVSYQNTYGVHFTNTIWDQLFHIINHSNYHRAQIATLMKESGIPPAATDYIFYRRTVL
jgi:uncharacterized damage-inducible protein DinB